MEPRHLRTCTKMRTRRFKAVAEETIPAEHGDLPYLGKKKGASRLQPVTRRLLKRDLLAMMANCFPGSIAALRNKAIAKCGEQAILENTGERSSAESHQKEVRFFS